MRRHTIALLTALSLSATACVVPGAMRPARYSSFSDVPATTAPTDGAIVLRSNGRKSASIVKFVREHRAQLEYCRDLERIHNPAFAGKASIEVTLEENGYVLRARVLQRDWNADGANMEDCMLTAIRRWDFPDSGPLDEFVHAFDVSLGDGQAQVSAPRSR